MKRLTGLPAATLGIALVACGGSGNADPSGMHRTGTGTAPAPAPAPRTGTGTRSGTGTSTGRNLPYALPAVGQAVAIGVNTVEAIRPPGLSSWNWAYSLFNSYGSGAFVPDYSFAGAFVIAGSGGHASPPNVDAAIFDFADAQWKRRANANGVVPREADYSVSETTGAPYYELRSATAGQIPTPAHLFQSAVYVPASLGGGAKGSYLKMGGSASAKESEQGSGIHRMDLDTGLWSRVTDDTLAIASPVGSAVFDPVTKRYYFVHTAFHLENSAGYLDATDWRVKRTPTFQYPAGLPGYGTVFLDPVRRLLIAQRNGFPLRALDLNNFAAGWVVLNMSGAQPAESENRWVFYEPDGRFYTRGNKAGQALSRLTPPTGDWKTGAWTYSTVTVGGAALPDHTTTGGDIGHYGTLFYVPYLQSMAWIAGESSNVILLKPPL